MSVPAQPPIDEGYVSYPTTSPSGTTGSPVAYGGLDTPMPSYGRSASPTQMGEEVDGRFPSTAEPTSLLLARGESKGKGGKGKRSHKGEEKEVPRKCFWYTDFLDLTSILTFHPKCKIILVLPIS
jgi:hypothetical protein